MVHTMYPGVLSPVASTHEEMDTGSNTSCPNTPVMVSLLKCLLAHNRTSRLSCLPGAALDLIPPQRGGETITGRYIA